MPHCYVEADSLPQAYHEGLSKLYNLGFDYPCDDGGRPSFMREISATIVVKNPLQENMISKLMIGDTHSLMQYQMELLDGILDFEVCPNKDGSKWSYTYHSRYKPQYDFVIEELKNNPSSRRAVFSIRDWKVDSMVSDPACWQYASYTIRDNKLNCEVLFRSNDATGAFPMNAFGLIKLQEKIANELCVKVGYYKHHATSFHCYERNMQTLKHYVNAIQGKSLMELTYNYEEEYKPLMCDEVPSILEMVAQQKAKKER